MRIELLTTKPSITDREPERSMKVRLVVIGYYVICFGVCRLKHTEGSFLWLCEFIGLYKWVSNMLSYPSALETCLWTSVV